MGDVIAGMLRAGRRRRGRLPGMPGFTGRGGPSWETRARAMEAMGHSPEKARALAKAGVMLGEPGPAPPTMEEEAARAGALTAARMKEEEPYKEAERTREAKARADENLRAKRKVVAEWLQDERRREREAEQKQRAGVDPLFKDLSLAAGINETQELRAKQAAEAQKKKDDAAELEKEQKKLLAQKTAEALFTVRQPGETPAGALSGLPPGMADLPESEREAEAGAMLRARRFAVPTQPKSQEELEREREGLTAAGYRGRPEEPPKPTPQEKAYTARLLDMEKARGLFRARDPNGEAIPEPVILDFLQSPPERKAQLIADAQQQGMGDEVVRYLTEMARPDEEF